LGDVPISLQIREGADKGIPLAISQPDSPQVGRGEYISFNLNASL